MTTAADIVNEIENVKAFFANRQGGGAGSDPALKKGFVDALMKLVALCPSINAENGKLVHDALKDNGHAGTARIIACIDSKMSAFVGHQDVDRQVLLKPSGWYMQEQWDILRDKRTQWTAKMTVGVEGLMNVGCRHPEEQTLRQLLGMLLAAIDV